MDGLPVVDVYVGTVVLESGVSTLGSAVVCEDTLGSAGGYDWVEEEEMGSGGKPGGGGSVVSAAGCDGTVGAVGSEFGAVGAAAVLNRLAKCTSVVRWESVMGCRVDAGDGLSSACMMSLAAAIMVWLEEAVGILTVDGNQARVSAIRSDAVSVANTR